jgi:uncharacterized protein (TIGR02452 family)
VLKLLPCLDSPEFAEANRRALDIDRSQAAALGKSAVAAACEGRYSRGNLHVDWSAAVTAAATAKVSIPPHAKLPAAASARLAETRVQVANETTLVAAKRLVERGLRPLALNFANGIQPGGGFCLGARAQEEVLCRSSALFQTLVDDPMYAEHRRTAELVETASDWAIYSPDVPVFRDDNGAALAQPWLLSFLTCAAPYAKRVGQPRSADLLSQRIERVLSIAQAYGHLSLVLGAWGCGAFGNDAQRAAADFRIALETGFDGVFSEVVFAVTDWSPERKFLGPFRDAFAAV